MDMKQALTLILGGYLLLASMTGCAIEESEDSEETTDKSNELVFEPDAGIRVDGGIPKATLTNEGTTYLYYENEGEMVALSENGLDFTGNERPTSYANDARNVEMPDGTWRRYSWIRKADDTFSDLESEISYDGINFVKESGIRYTLQESDNEWAGFYDMFTNCNDEVILIYLADNYGLNNARMAISRDGGLNFDFEKEDVFNDAQYGGTFNSYVDQSSIPLEDDTRLMFTMKQGTIYWFSSDCVGKEWELEEGSLKPSEYTEFNLATLHDPSIVINDDGSYRMYMGAWIEENGQSKEVILSAVTEL
ncbi:MAG: hypothetical protein ABIF40_00795 [archaeon]